MRRDSVAVSDCRLAGIVATLPEAAPTWSGQGASKGVRRSSMGGY
jgi:hypothetical protein